MDGLSISADAIPVSMGKKWAIKEFGNFDGLNSDYIILQHTDGRIYIYLMNGVTVLNSDVVAAPPPTWVVH